MPNYIDNQVDIPAPRPLFSATSSAADYPLEQLPPVLKAAAAAIASYVQAPPALAGQCVIGAATHLLQTRINAPSILNSMGMPCSLYLLSLGNSGDRKTACRNLAFQVIDTLEHTAKNQHKQQIDAILLKAQQLPRKEREEFLANNPLPIDPSYQTTDATFESLAGAFIRGQSAATWDTDEGSQLLCGPSLKSDISSSIVGGLCRGFDRGIFERRRARGNLEGSGAAYNRRLSIHLLAQPLAVATALNDPILIAQGFLPRFLFAAPESIAGSRFLNEERLQMTPHTLPQLQKFWQRCQDIHETLEHIDQSTSEVLPPVLELTQPGLRLWLEFYNGVESELDKSGKYAEVCPFASRAGELARRIATVLAGFEGFSTINDDMMSRACHLTQHSLNEWLRYSESRDTDPVLIRAQSLLEWLKAKDWNEFHRDQLGKSGPSRERPAKRRDRLLEVLVEYRQLLTHDGKTFYLNQLAETAVTQHPSIPNDTKQLRKAAELEFENV